MCNSSTKGRGMLAKSLDLDLARFLLHSAQPSFPVQLRMRLPFES